MSTKRPSVIVQSDLIQKFNSSDFDQVALLDSRIAAIEAIVNSIEDIPALLALTDTLTELVSGDLYVTKPLLNAPVDYAAEGYAEVTLGALLAAMCLDITATKVANTGALIIADSTGSSAYTAPNAANLSNDGLGTIPTIYAPLGITSFYDSGTDALDFSEFALGDLVTLRVDVDVETLSTDQSVDLLLSLGEGGINRLQTISSNFYPATGTYNLVGEINIVINHQDIIDNPGHIQIKSASNANVTVNTFEAFINAKS